MSRSFSIIYVFQFDKCIKLLISIFRHDKQKKNDRTDEIDKIVQLAKMKNIHRIYNLLN
jgi:hypothetical protein